MKIGILVTNTDNSGFAQSQPSDGEKFTRLMQTVRPDWTYEVYNCVEDDFPARPDACDGYIIGGSPASVNDQSNWIDKLSSLIRTLNVECRPMAGCCFGHQLIAKSLGGTVEKNHGGWGFGIASTHVEVQQAWMQPLQSSISLFAAHTEQVTRLPAQAICYGGNSFCKVGGFVIGNHVMTTEYHPEMTQGFFIGLTHAFEKYIGRDVAAEARKQAEGLAEGHVFAEWIAKFFELGVKPHYAKRQVTEP